MWYLIIIDDAPKFLLGKSFIDILQLLFSTRKFNFIITDSIEGSGKDWVISNLQDKKNKIFKFEEIMKILCGITQLEWGDFFLFEKYPQNWTNIEGNLYSNLVAQSNTVIRAVDNQIYIYIYIYIHPILKLLN